MSHQNRELLEALRASFPQFFTTKVEDGQSVERLDLEQLRLLIGEGNYREKFGLRWENKPEQFEADSRGKWPSLARVPNKRIHVDASKPSHVLIEGDNYHALKVLSYTHEHSIDVIYLDPPYNTGNKDFKYNDRFVDREDGYRHSKWLSFMAKRLKLARNLLKDSGFLFISIDDNELAQLKLLCDEVFGAENCVATVPVVTNLKGNNDQFAFAGTHEYLLCYVRVKAKAVAFELPLDDEEAGDWLEDEQGPYKVGANLKATGQNAPRSKRPNLFFPLYVSPDLTISISRTSAEQEEVWPITDGREMSWRWQRSTFERDFEEVIVRGEPGSYAIYKKQRPALGDLPSKKPKSVLYHPAYSTSTATGELKDIFEGERAFTGPKATRFVRDLLQVACPPSGVVLDFFAGSGTTAHAVMLLNQQDGGARQCILVTNDEGDFKDASGTSITGGICTHVTYPRLQRVIEGYTSPRRGTQKGLGENLEFFQTAFRLVPQSRNQRRDFVRFSSELLCLKAKCFTPVEANSKWALFKGDGKHLFVLFDEYEADAAVTKLRDVHGPVEAYVFAYERDDDSAEVLSQLSHVSVQEVPQPLLDLFHRMKD